MHFQLPSRLDDLAAKLPQFLMLVGREEWFKRADQLALDGQSSPYLAKIIIDRHWLEMELSHQLTIFTERGRLSADDVPTKSLAALQFAAMVTEVHDRLSARGRGALNGRLRDGLNTDFPGLYLEMEMAQQLMGAGYDVEFPDLQGEARFDLLYRKGSVEGEVECKSLSADAGRKIHRSDFYRFVDGVSAALSERMSGLSREALIVTVEDRFPSDMESQRDLRRASLGILSGAEPRLQHGAIFTVELTPLDTRLSHALTEAPKSLYATCREVFGDNCHVAGGMTPTGGCLVVVRSRKEDDHSKPLLEAIKKASDQLTGRRPGFVAVQYDDLEPQELTLPHLRRRSALIANFVFHTRESSHLAGVYYCAFAGLHASHSGVAIPAFICTNPRFSLSSECLPFGDPSLSNSDFARVLGVDPNDTDPDGFSYGTGM